jgi:hypothetical protein
MQEGQMMFAGHDTLDRLDLVIVYGHLDCRLDLLHPHLSHKKVC